ncbi:hypothetical protein DNTS_035497 [Danionella cerebrum]|uniref:Uncharacterized protein n=1 Tax=Danionella cerebrum TaxID=2873325 RepID=A0A553R690_9TELE|nr:hypothetical protein DNTS_035497 [Danionella translucida]
MAMGYVSLCTFTRRFLGLANAPQRIQTYGGGLVGRPSNLSLSCRSALEAMPPPPRLWSTSTGTRHPAGGHTSAPGGGERKETPMIPILQISNVIKNVWMLDHPPDDNTKGYCRLEDARVNGLRRDLLDEERTQRKAFSSGLYDRCQCLRTRTQVHQLKPRCLVLLYPGP